MEVQRLLVLDPSIELIDLGDGRLQLFREKGALTVNDKDGDIRRLIGWCDGTRDEGEIRALMAKRRPGGAELVQYLVQSRCLIPARPPPKSNLLNQIHAAHLELAQVGFAQRQELAGRPLKIALSGKGEFAREALSVLEGLGHEIGLNLQAFEAGAQDLVVALSDELDHATFRNLNSRAVKQGIPVIYGCIDRHLLRIGPVVIPGETACFECHHHRLRSHVKFLEEFDGRTEGRRLRPIDLITPWLEARVGAVLLAMVVSGFAADNLTIGKSNEVLELDLLNITYERHHLLKLPRCPVCGPGRIELIQPAIYAEASQ
jgi:bacteriocin biosynthesis cyclodehydratase domain-containing protein